MSAQEPLPSLDDVDVNVGGLTAGRWGVRLLSLFALVALIWAFNDMNRIREWLWATQDLAEDVGGLVENEGETTSDEGAAEAGPTGILDPLAQPIYTAEDAISVTLRMASQYHSVDREDGSVRDVEISKVSAEARLLTLGQYIDSEGLGWYTEDHPKRDFFDTFERFYDRDTLIWAVLLELAENGEPISQDWLGVWGATYGGLYDQGERPKGLQGELERLRPSKGKIAHATARPTWTPFPTRTPGPAATLNAFERGEVERMEAALSEGRIQDLIVRKIRGTDYKNFERFRGEGSSYEPSGYWTLVYFKARAVDEELVPGWWSFGSPINMGGQETPPVPTWTPVPISERPLQGYFFDIHTDDTVDSPTTGGSRKGRHSLESHEEETAWLEAYPAPE